MDKEWVETLKGAIDKLSKELKENKSYEQKESWTTAITPNHLAFFFMTATEEEKLAMIDIIVEANKKQKRK